MKIDVNTIEGYADMTPEEKVQALEGLELTDTDTEKRYKDLISKANSEANYLTYLTLGLNVIPLIKPRNITLSLDSLLSCA